jgi:hypothetical protein
MPDLTVSWVQPTVRRKVVWNFTRHEIVTYWQADPRGEFAEVDRLRYTDDNSAWHIVLVAMNPNPYIGPQDWHAI